MLNETYELLKTFKERLPFEADITLFIENKVLIVRTSFHKYLQNHTYVHVLSKEMITNILTEQAIIDNYINRVLEFYNSLYRR